MKMFLISLEDHEDLTCEHCGEEDGKYGAVKNETVLDLWVDRLGMTKIEATQYLLWEEAKGMILCASCLKGADMRNFLSIREHT